jgi:hypothetical protein
MFGTMGDSPKRAGSLLPPATTRRLPERPAASPGEARIAPPFIPAGSIQPDPEPQPQASAPIFEPPAQRETPALVASAPDQDEPAADSTPPSLAALDADIPDGEGIVEPVFQADTDSVLAELTQHADEASRREEFPLDAFIVPEHTQHVPSGLENGLPHGAPDSTPVTSLAERLEKLSHRLRVEDTDAVVRRLAAGDRLDSLLAGLLAGYLAGKSEQQ